MPNRHLSLERWHELLDGELSAAEESQALLHLESCERCTEEAEGLIEVDALARLLPAEVGPRRNNTPWARRPLGIAAASLFLLISAGIGFRYLRQEKREIAAPRSARVPSSTRLAQVIWLKVVDTEESRDRMERTTWEKSLGRSPTRSQTLVLKIPHRVPIVVRSSTTGG